jgi:hypothetical protein
MGREGPKVIEMIAKHTPEPWALNGLRIESKEEHGWANGGWIIAEVFGDDASANARRVVACVNACAGVHENYLQAVIEEGGAAKFFTQRDELLVALETLFEAYQKAVASSDWDVDAGRIATAAIAKAKGK